MEPSSLGLWPLLLLACWPLPPGLAGENLVNFLGGDNKCEGQIQLLYDGQWGLMCGDGLGMQEASVICRQLGCGSVHSISQYILTPEEMKQPWLYGAQCRGEEATLWECLLGPWGPLSGCKCQCVAVIICSGGTTRQIGLADGSSPCAGIPEATGLSGLPLRCDLQKEEAGVLCRELECGTALQWSRAHHSADRKQEEKYIKCKGTEPDILHCQINVNFLEQCDLLTYTQVMCTGGTGFGSVRTLGFKGSWKKVEAWHHVAGSEFLKRAHDRLLVKISLVAVVTPKIWSSQYKGMTTKDSSSCGVELA
ncbi:scavenger receptor cysteine-rich domain-containing protein SCART1-like [Peromyscus maniculatus bairdii]|uniref:scavenger receptor cysteine-rich domain-containing protein SCART1-like n=1 Tax=Peromyscus maniculatus bairdii TaxID=230844 RepID=UPI003FD3991C